MKVRVSLLGLIFFISVTGSAQTFHDSESRQQQNVGYSDPFDTMDIQIEHPAANWPNNNSPVRRSNESAATVSFQQLQHKVPKQALKEYKKGRAASAKGDKESALDHFQNAVQIDADFANAHNDLGVVLAKLGNTDEAAEEFQKAVELAPNHAAALGNLSLTLYMLTRYHDALPLARRALKLDPNLIYVRYVLALSLIAEHGDSKEALENLELAAPQFPEARVIASNILVQIGRRDEAASELEAYLRSAPKAESSRQEIEIRLAQLRQ